MHPVLRDPSLFKQYAYASGEWIAAASGEVLAAASRPVPQNALALVALRLYRVHDLADHPFAFYGHDGRLIGVASLPCPVPRNEQPDRYHWLGERVVWQGRCFRFGAELFGHFRELYHPDCAKFTPPQPTDYVVTDDGMRTSPKDVRCHNPLIGPGFEIVEKELV